MIHLPRSLRKLKNKFLLYASQKLDGYPCLKKWLYQLYYLIWRFTLKKRYVVTQIPNPDKTYLVNPNIIKYAHVTSFSTLERMVKVVDGDWDLPKNRRKFEDLDVYEAFCQRFLNHKEWNETQFYHRVLDTIIGGQDKWGCISKEQLDDRCRNLDKLYQDIKDNGYKTQRELNASSMNLFFEDEIAVSIARTGELLFTDGRHRLCIAKILGLKEVPVVVWIRHPEWIEFRNQILARAEDLKVKKLYQPLTHPDLADIPSHYADDRFDIIRRNLSIKTGTLLDIGAYWGYFCHKFEDEGFDCYAVENSPSNVYFLNKLREAENKKFKVFYGSIFNFQERNDFDVVLALNVFHSFLKQEGLYLKLIELLRRLKMRELFFEAANYNEPQMEDAYKHYSLDEFVAFILEHSCLKEAKYIGESEGGRSLYKLYQ
jgi:2-polyprenyl-3-methyl-5-hydroxy-6-metoxy-1,4-benzoquinol methylase